MNLSVENSSIKNRPMHIWSNNFHKWVKAIQFMWDFFNTRVETIKQTKNNKMAFIKIKIFFSSISTILKTKKAIIDWNKIFGIKKIIPR